MYLMEKNKSLYIGFLIVLAVGTTLYTLTGKQLANKHYNEPKIDFTIVGRGRSLQSVISTKRKARLLKSAEIHKEHKNNIGKGQVIHNMEEDAQAGHGGHMETIQREALVIFFIAIVLIIATFFRSLHKNYGVPYTPMLMFAGTIIGRYRDSLGDFGKAADIIF